MYGEGVCGRGMKLGWNWMPASVSMRNDEVVELLYVDAEQTNGNNMLLIMLTGGRETR